MTLKIRELPPELLEAAKEELHEDPSRREADVAYIREWLKKQPHIRANPDDQTLIAFLRGCKFSLERTKEKLDMYYTMRTALPDFFGERNIKKSNSIIREIMELATFFPLPECDPLGRRVYVARAGLTDLNKHKIEDAIKMNFMMYDVMIREDDRAIVKGVVNLMDMGKISLGHTAQMSPSLIKKISACSEEGYPLRPKGMNFINTPSIFYTIFNIFKSFAKEKIKRRLYVHGDDFESLYTNIPQRMLPTEYGGEAGTIKELNDAWIKKVESYHDWFLEDIKNGVDESKRPGKPKTQQDLFGLEGSFRQLNVD